MRDYNDITCVHRFANLVCPISKAPLFLSKDDLWLYCLASNLAYPIKNQIPVMLPSEARALTDDERATLKAKYPK